MNQLRDFNKKKIDFILKPDLSRGGRNVYIIENKLNKQFSKNFNREKHIPKKNFNLRKLKFSKKNYPVIIMEKLVEPSYDIDILSHGGKLLNFVVRQRIGSQGIDGNIIKKYDKRFEKFSKNIVKACNDRFKKKTSIIGNKS